MIALAWIGGLILVILGCYWLVFHEAPRGYEDDDGFHYGEPESRSKS